MTRTGRTIARIATLALAAGTLVGCETVKGIGEDLQNLGDSLASGMSTDEIQAQIDKARAQFASGDLEQVIWAKVKVLQRRAATQRERDKAEAKAKQDRETWDPKLKDQVEDKDIKQIVVVEDDPESDTVQVVKVDPKTGKADGELSTVPRDDVVKAKEQGGFGVLDDDKGIYAI